MQVKFSISPKYMISITGFLAAAIAPLQAAAMPPTHRHQTTPIHRAPIHGLTLHLDRGYRLLYSFTMSSQALFDMSAALRQHAPNTDTSHTPKMTLVTALKGTVELVPIDGFSNHGGRDRIQVLCTLQPDELRLEQNGIEITEPVPQLLSQLAQPILIEYTNRGRIASVHFDASCDSTTQGFARTLLAYLQVSLPNDVTQPTWQAAEPEPNGVFVTRYTCQTATHTTLTLSKTKCGPATTTSQATSDQLSASQTVTPSGALTVTLDAQRGLIRSVRGTEDFATMLGTASIAHSRNMISLALQDRFPITPSRSQALLQMARGHLQVGQGRSLAESPQITPQQEAHIQRDNLGGATVQQVLAQLADLDGAAMPDKQARELLPRLKACIYLYPEICSTLRTQLLSAPPDKIRMALTVEALRAAGHPSAQKTLIAVLKARHNDLRAAGLLIPTLAQLQAPIPQVDFLLQEIASGKDDTMITSMAFLAMGALAHNLAPQDAERAHHLTLALQRRLQEARSNHQKRTVLLALANAAEPSTLPTLLRQVQDRSPEVRGTALLALGRLPGERAERPICAALTTEPDANVRLAATMAAAGKLNSFAVRQKVLYALHNDRNAQVRIRAMYTLWNGARSQPDVEAGVQTAAVQDASEDVRQAARTLLAAK